MPRLTLSLLAVLAVAFAACGGDETLSSKEYKAEAKKICEGTRQRIEAVKQPTKATSESVVAYLREVLKVNQDTPRRFKALEPPESIKPEHDKAVAALDSSVAEVDRLLKELESGKDAKQVIQANQQRLTQVTQEANSAIKSLDVPECVS